MLLFLFACSSDPAAQAPPASQAPPPVDPGPAAAAPRALDCNLLTPADIAAAFGTDAAGVQAQPVEEFRGRKMCAWTFAGGRVDVQVTPPPKSNTKGWGARMIQGKLADGFQAESGLGSSAAYASDRHQIFWHDMDTALLHVSAAGDRPGAPVPHDTLRTLADRVDAAYRR